MFMLFSAFLHAALGCNREIRALPRYSGLELPEFQEFEEI